MIGTKAKREERSSAVASGLLLAMLVAAWVLLGAGPAHAKTFTVNSTGDATDVALDGSCDANLRFPAVACTLRTAIEEANNRIQNPGADAIIFRIPPPPTRAAMRRTAFAPSPRLRPCPR